MFRQGSCLQRKAACFLGFAAERNRVRKCYADNETMLILVIAQTIFMLSQIQNLFAALVPLQCHIMKINMLTWLGLFSVDCSICMTFTCGHARKLRALELRSVKTAVSIVMPDSGKLLHQVCTCSKSTYDTKDKAGDFSQIFVTVRLLDWLPFIYLKELQVYKNDQQNYVEFMFQLKQRAIRQYKTMS